MHAITVALEHLTAAATTIALHDQLQDPGTRMELARQLRSRADQLEREAAMLHAMAVGIGCTAEAEIAPEGVVVTEDGE